MRWKEYEISSCILKRRDDTAEQAWLHYNRLLEKDTNHSAIASLISCLMVDSELLRSKCHSCVRFNSVSL